MYDSENEVMDLLLQMDDWQADARDSDTLELYPNQVRLLLRRIEVLEDLKEFQYQ
jgi:hypothetical protein